MSDQAEQDQFQFITTLYCQALSEEKDIEEDIWYNAFSRSY